ncbi:MAG: hypothetical protein MUC66_06140 [Methanolinea sp.]|jgi:hypothetical protein|nr:hypothetical protein [Methanolinea sp.]
MKTAYVLLLLLSLAAVLAYGAGCTSTAPASMATPQPTTSGPGPAGTQGVSPESVPSLSTLKGLILDPTDFPEGYSLVYEGEMLPGVESCPVNDLCYLQGYALSIATGDANNSTMVDQAISRYSLNATSETIEGVFKDQIPEIAAGNLTALSGPALGDASAAYRFEFPPAEAPIKGYLVIFGKGDLYEIIMVIGTDTDENLVYDLAKKSAAKLP